MKINNEIRKGEELVVKFCNTKCIINFCTHFIQNINLSIARIGHRKTNRLLDPNLKVLPFKFVLDSERLPIAVARWGFWH